MAYPATKSNVTATTLLADAGHAAMHNAMEAVIGTTAGTSLMMNFAAGDFPVNGNSGTLNNGVLGTPIISGGTVGTAVIGTSAFIAGSVGTAFIRGGTIGTALIGTSTVQGGTVANAIIGTSQMWGGTIGTAIIGTSTVVGGAINNAAIGTPTITGGNFNSGTFGTITVNQGSDATGDLYYRNASGAFTRLAMGTNMQVLTTNGTTPSWGHNAFASGCSVTASGVGTIASGGTTQIAFDTEVYDLGNEYDTTNKHFVATNAGKYLMDASLNIATFEPTKRYYLGFFQNGTAQKYTINVCGTGVTSFSAHGHAIMDVAAGGTLAVYVINTGTGNLVHDNVTTNTWLMIQRLY